VTGPRARRDQAGCWVVSQLLTQPGCYRVRTNLRGSALSCTWIGGRRQTQHAYSKRLSEDLGYSVR
jgi:hypothetical protein